MTTLREAAQQALEAMEAADVDPHSSDAVHKAIDVLKAALADPVQEPVAWMYTGIKQDGTEHGPHLVWNPAYMDAMSASKGVQATPLYAAPPQLPAAPVQEPVAWVHPTHGHMQRRTETMSPEVVESYERGGWMPLYTAPTQRKPLTDEEIQELSQQHKFDSRMEKFVRIIERAHGIGGNDE